MFYKLRPVDMRIVLRDRDYRLGEMIEVVIELNAASDVTVREARAELVCEERRVESFGFSAPGLYADSGVAGPRSQIPNKVINEKKESYTHSAVSFMADTRLRGGVRTMHASLLKIEQKPPVHVGNTRALQVDASDSWTFTWTLVTTLDVVRGRNPSRQRPVRVRLY